MITVSELRRAGSILDSSKLAILGNQVSSSIKKRTKGKYVVKFTITGRKIKFRLMVRDESGKLKKPIGDEEEILSGRISSYLNENSVSHNIVVR